MEQFIPRDIYQVTELFEDLLFMRTEKFSRLDSEDSKISLNKDGVDLLGLTSHSAQLTANALIDAVEKSGLPDIIHSDQGREYTARVYTQFAENLRIKISMSHKGCPWGNGYQESFYSQFKVDLGDPGRFKTLGELAAVRNLSELNSDRLSTS